MLSKVASFEARYQLKNPVFWVSFVLFFLLGFGVTASENVSIGTPGTVHENAPFAIAMMIAASTLFYLFVTTSFVANAIVRDDVTNFAPILRATQVSRLDFVLGRFAGGLATCLIGFLAVPLGMGFGVMMPWVDPETVGPGGIWVYLWNYLLIGVPNIFWISAALFALTTLTRSMMATYIGVVAFLIIYLVATSIIGPRPEYFDLLARFEPFGQGAVMEATRYWTAAELNARLLQLSGNMLFNRVLVVALGVIFLALTCWRFSMQERAPSRRALRKLEKQRAKEARLAAVTPSANADHVRQEHNATTLVAQLRVRFGLELGQVLKSPGLIVLLLLAIVQTIAIILFDETSFGTTSYPITSTVIEAIRGGFSIFLLVIAGFFGGELVWRERDRQMNEIFDSTPTPAWVMFIPKIVAIFAVLVLVNIGGAITGILAQLAKGVTDISIANYVEWLIIPLSVDMLLYAILAVFVQVLSPNKFLGWGIMLAWFISGIFLRNMGYSNILYTFSGTPAEPISDINGGGGFVAAALWARLYWLSFGVILLVLAHGLWPRGTVTALGPRIAALPQRVRGTPLVIAVVGLASMVGTGLFIHDNIKRLNTYRTTEAEEKLLADLEKKYLKFENLSRPVVTNVQFTADLFPKQRRLDVTGSYVLRNDTGAPIEQVHLRQSSQDVTFRKLAVKGARLEKHDQELGYRIFRFATPMMPGETRRIDFVSRIWHRGFRNGRPPTDIVYNGSFVNNYAFGPIVGMDRNNLLNDRAIRRRQGLPAELRPAKLENLSARKESYFRADWVQSDITLTTDADQTPIAPGKKIADDVRGNRRTARFVSTAPILNFFAIQSARYALDERMHKGVRLSVYYHKPHHWNVPVIQKALANSLDYYTSNFGPYQFDYARIIEFPGYERFAQAFAGSMPYSEAIGFAADLRDPDKIDYVTFVTAHEVAHQYWAHQVIGAEMQGGTFLSESLAEYSAIMVMQKMYGRDKLRRFLKYELDRYLGGRKGEAVEELPLTRVENQQYIHYPKGSMALFLLQERIGEAAVNRALARFIARFRFKAAPFPRSLDLIDEFRKEARTPEHQALITDLFEKITVYDLKAKQARAKKAADGTWTTTLTVEARKYYANGKGVETETPLNDAIEAGLFAARPGIGAFSAKDVILMERRPVRAGKQELVFKSAKKPAFVGIDPYNFYIDRDSDDNVIDVSE